MANSRKVVPAATPATTTNRTSFISNGNPWLIPGLLALIAVLLILLLFRSWDGPARNVDNGFSTKRISRMERGISAEPRSFLGNSGNHIIGAVTAVDGSSFTVVGNGTSTKVDTNSSTKYWGGSSVQVNDTVGVLGTNNNGTITASEIVINP